MFFLTLSFFLMLFILQQTHPLNFSLNLLAISCLTGAYIMQVLSTWIGLSLVLIFMGGMMIIILYVSALASENKFTLSSLVPTALILLLLFIPPMPSLTSSAHLFHPIFALYLDCSSHSLLLLLFYLLLTLVVVVNVSESHHGPVSMWN